MLRAAHAGELHGTVRVPGDKSISHRAALLAALADGAGTIDGFLEAADTRATLDAIVALGIRVERPGPAQVRIHGTGATAWREPEGPLDLGNSGTAMRLLAGVLAGRGVAAVLTGDASLSRRPMARVVEPLRKMGAGIDGEDGHAPLVLTGGSLRGCDHHIPVASAQVASCLLFAGLHADGVTRVTLPAPVRDHLERLLEWYGIAIEREGTTTEVRAVDWDGVSPRTVQVPGDPSSAAFFAVGAAIVPGSEIVLPGLCANPARTGFVTVLRRMGAEMEWGPVRQQCGEPVADLYVRGKRLRGTEITADEVPGVIDELPALMVAAACADGETRVHGAGELRVKESDRLRTVAGMLTTFGIRVAERADGLDVAGGPIVGGRVDAGHDHRIAMAAAIAGLRSTGAVEVDNSDGIETSFPAFVATAQAAGLEMVDG